MTRNNKCSKEWKSNPCLCMPLEYGVSILALIEMLLDIVLAVLGMVGGISTSKGGGKKKKQKIGSLWTGIIWGYLILACICLILSILLFMGGRERERSKVRVWFRISLISWLLWWGQVALDVAFLRKNPYFRVSLGVTLGTQGVKGYTLVVVHAFLERMRREELGLGLGDGDEESLPGSPRQSAILNQGAVRTYDASLPPSTQRRGDADDVESAEAKELTPQAPAEGQGLSKPPDNKDQGPRPSTQNDQVSVLEQLFG